MRDTRYSMMMNFSVYKPFINFLLYVCTAVVFVFGASQLISSMRIGEFLESTSSSTDVYENYYVDAKEVNISFPEKRRNLVYIFL